jgi:hypothetical protein
MKSPLWRRNLAGAHDRFLLHLFLGGEGWDEGEQLFAPQRHNLIRLKKSVLPHLAAAAPKMKTLGKTIGKS